MCVCVSLCHGTCVEVRVDLTILFLSFTVRTELRLLGMEVRIFPTELSHWLKQYFAKGLSEALLWHIPVTGS